MSISHKDFVPVKKKGKLFKAGSVQELEEVIQEMNIWITEMGPEIISTETLLLPNIHDSAEEGSEDTELLTYGESSSHWYQIVRVWYKS